jgi:tRNA-splicing ligase RtcB
VTNSTRNSNKLALESSPHGAGRRFSRTVARTQFTHEQLREAMVGIECRDAADLAEVRHTLHQILNVKGS